MTEIEQTHFENLLTKYVSKQIEHLSKKDLEEMKHYKIPELILGCINENYDFSTEKLKDSSCVSLIQKWMNENHLDNEYLFTIWRKVRNQIEFKIKSIKE